MTPLTLRALREKILNFKDGTVAHRLSERVEVRIIHKTLNVVLAELDALSALDAKRKPWTAYVDLVATGEYGGLIQEHHQQFPHTDGGHRFRAIVAALAAHGPQEEPPLRPHAWLPPQVAGEADGESLKVKAELDEWRTGKMADATGHMLRCARVNGQWKCAKGCAMKALQKAEAELARLRAADAHGPAPYGSEVLCPACATVFCPHGEWLHFHHDGCPACDGPAEAPALAAPPVDRPICMMCSGTGWCEGSPAFTCPECKGSGVAPDRPAEEAK